MKAQVLAFLVFGLGGGGIFWLVWDYIWQLRRQMHTLRQQVRELESRNSELILALEDRAEAARLDEAIRKGRFRT